MRLPLIAQSHIILYSVNNQSMSSDCMAKEESRAASNDEFWISQQSLSACIYGVIHSPILSTMCYVEAVSSVVHDDFFSFFIRTYLFTIFNWIFLVSIIYFHSVVFSGAFYKDRNFIMIFSSVMDCVLNLLIYFEILSKTVIQSR